ncbi:MAG: ribosome-associated translation inhibitor RaiA [Luteibaculaceae bacterium]|jgi:ribosome-associated translation inhibitor RaiA
MISEKRNRFSSHISRLEVHLTDADGKRDSQKDKRCTLEARIQGRKSLAVTCHADSLELAVYGAIDKIKASLDSALNQQDFFK